MILFILLNLKLTVFSQTDSSNIKEPVKCLTISTFKKIAEDLLKGDSAKAMLELSNEEIFKLEEKIVLKDSVIYISIQKEENYKNIIKTHEQKFSDLEKHNNKIVSELKKQKTKNKFKGFLSNILIISLVTLLIVK